MANPNSIKQPFWQPVTQQYASDQVSVAHSEALYRVGEYVMFILMWRVVDFERGLVGRCPICFPSYSLGEIPGRISAAYKQPTKNKCVNLLVNPLPFPADPQDPRNIAMLPLPDGRPALGCYGTGFYGGYRAKVIRPAVVSDTSPDTQFGSKGEFVTDSVNLETTTDIFTHNGDYAFRSNGSRLRCEEMDVISLRSGFGPQDSSSLGGIIPKAQREEISSVAFLIPPTPAKLTVLLLGLAQGRHTPADLAVLDDLRGPLVDIP